QQYFAYYYNHLTGLNRSNSFPQTEASLAELASESASSLALQSSPSSSFDTTSPRVSNKADTSSVTGTPSKKPIRVDVNDLFSLSKTYSETSLLQDSSRVLFDRIQNQQEHPTDMSGDRNGADGIATEPKIFHESEDKKKRKKNRADMLAHADGDKLKNKTSAN